MDNNIKSNDSMNATPTENPTGSAPVESVSQQIRLERWVFFRLNGKTGEPINDISGMALKSDLTPDNINDSYFIAMGDAYNRPNFAPGEPVITSLIAEFSDNQIRTRSGTVYHLGEMHPDYAAFVEAAEKYPVIDNWSLGTATISEDPNAPKGVYIKGQLRGDSNDTRLVKRIIEQNGTTITCHDGTKYCVDWCAVNVFQKFMLEVLASPSEKQHDKVTPVFSYFGYKLNLSCEFLSINWDSYASECPISFQEGQKMWGTPEDTN